VLGLRAHGAGSGSAFGTGDNGGVIEVGRQEAGASWGGAVFWVRSGEFEEEVGVFLDKGGGEIVGYWIELGGDCGPAALEGGAGFVG
jgi:hypothetical protein